ncbi:MAG: hypothetical protein KAX28_03825 [Candidatus Marinimicrobia bacterium]|nr:hypothetical protein [Candidatus Neomarinimicrobiota bacterium]
MKHNHSSQPHKEKEKALCTKRGLSVMVGEERIVTLITLIWAYVLMGRGSPRNPPLRIAQNRCLFPAIEFMTLPGNIQ